MAIMTSFHAAKCCHLTSEHKAFVPARLCSSARQLLIMQDLLSGRGGTLTRQLTSPRPYHYTTEPFSFL